MNHTEVRTHTFRPFDRVLVRDSDTPWRATLYSHKFGERHCCVGGWWDHCVPFEGNEHLLGTTDWTVVRFKRVEE